MCRYFFSKLQRIQLSEEFAGKAGTFPWISSQTENSQACAKEMLESHWSMNLSRSSRDQLRVHASGTTVIPEDRRAISFSAGALWSRILNQSEQLSRYRIIDRGATFNLFSRFIVHFSRPVLAISSGKSVSSQINVNLSQNLSFSLSIERIRRSCKKKRKSFESFTRIYSLASSFQQEMKTTLARGVPAYY